MFLRFFFIVPQIKETYGLTFAKCKVLPNVRVQERTNYKGRVSFFNFPEIEIRHYLRVDFSGKLRKFNLPLQLVLSYCQF